MDFITTSIRNILIENVKSLKQTIEEIGETFRKEMKPIYESLLLLREEFDTRDSVNAMIIESGYPPIWDIDIILEIQKKMEEEKDFDNFDVSSIIVNYFKSGEIGNFLDEWSRVPFLRERMSILESVVECHKFGLYYSSVSTLLPQFEGIIFEFFNHNYKYKENYLRIYLEQLLLTSYKAEGDSFNDKVMQYYKKYILVGFYGKEVASEISRHAFAHGYLKNFGTEQNSLKLLLLFNQIVTFLYEMYDEEIEKAKILVGLEYEKDRDKKKATLNANHNLKQQLKEKEKENEKLKALFLEFVGYEDEWLPTVSSLNKKTKKELTACIIEQRLLMREQYKMLDASLQEELKKKVEHYLWPIMHSEA
ncbi:MULTISPECIES: hypothetical protein [Bacillus amyloliquefaciens group]|uniref:Uncharacterized protein n=1 Tax=Bacillus velezensis TaxID=492670 RepID=A0ABC8D9W9_BACVE|nr:MULTISPECIES: hypothetical protein [Bacillus amyloliquefaciens group]ANB49283.1 hypothetical protein A1D33_018515 [Bacillus velezensis]AVI28985.1 hypothetical protein C3Z10_11615 [Bacillus velezensis]AWX72639.1 hypothetical protein BVDSYZ_11640 [Bacillus velezensis]MDK2560161.1 hypothetical protein [Bacillus amyloliquefaciens]WPB68789.1 hypothetical protein SBO70_11590 [Bacillus velezensis]